MNVDHLEQRAVISAGLGTLGVVGVLFGEEHIARLVAHHLGVVPRWDEETSPAAISPSVPSAMRIRMRLESTSRGGKLAGVGLGDRLHGLGPAPAGLKDGPSGLSTDDIDQLHPALPFERACLVGRVEALYLDSRRRDLLSGVERP